MNQRLVIVIAIVLAIVLAWVLLFAITPSSQDQPVQSIRVITPPPEADDEGGKLPSTGTPAVTSQVEAVQTMAASGTREWVLSGIGIAIAAGGGGLILAIRPSFRKRASF